MFTPPVTIFGGYYLLSVIRNDELNVSVAYFSLYGGGGGGDLMVMGLQVVLVSMTYTHLHMATVCIQRFHIF